MRLLLAEDERELSDALAAILTHHSFSVDAVYNGNDAYDYGSAENYAGILMDVMMPGMSGVEVVRRLRAEGVSTPVLMLTAKSETEDIVTGLDSGADDYLTKPFEMPVLLARVRALVRRSAGVTAPILTCGDLELDPATLMVSCGHQSMRLGNKEYQMLEMLLRRPGAVISTQTFFEHIWGYDAEADIGVVWVAISALRKKLAGLGSEVKLKVNRGAGYYLEAPPSVG